MNQLILRSATVLESNKTSRSVTKRNSGLVAAQSANPGVNTTAMASTSTTCKLQTGKSSHAVTIRPPRIKSKKVNGIKTATKWVTKETNGSQIRVRKVFMQNSNQQHPRIGSAGKPASLNHPATTLAQMSKSAEGKMPGFNLLTTSKERKRTHQNLAPLKQKSNKG